MKNQTKSNKSQPIGVFDSGIGGLTVLKEISALMPTENAVYIGDTARVPYGNKSKETVTAYAAQISSHLIDKGVKIIVIACNTASAYSLKELQDSLPVPVVGVIVPGAKKAVDISKTKHIGVIGTEATISSNAYEEAIKNIDDSINVSSTHCPLFAPLAEEGWLENKVADEVAKEYLSHYRDNSPAIDTLVLGCTHYPLLKNTISNIMGSNVELIDSATATAEEVKIILTEKELLNDAKDSGEYHFFATDSTERFKKVGGRFFGEKLSTVELLKL